MAAFKKTAIFIWYYSNELHELISANLCDSWLKIIAQSIQTHQ